MRILFTSKKNGWSGETAHIQDLVLGCRAAGHEVIAGMREGSELWRRLAPEGVRCEPLELVHEVTAIGALVRDRRKLRTLLANVDVVHTHASWDTWVVALSRARLPDPPPLVRTRHNLKAIRPHRMNRWLYRKALTCVTVPSRTIEQDLRAAALVPPENIRRIDYGIDTGVFDPARFDTATARQELREELGAPPDAPIVAYVSRVAPRKQPEVFVEAALELLRRGTPAWFILVGAFSEADGWGTALRERIDGQGPRLRALRQRKDIPRLLAGCDVFALPSPNEPFGLAPVEAMAMGCPPVCANAAGLAESVVDGVTGLLFPPGDVTACADRIEDLLVGRVDREAMRRAGQAHVREHFSLQRVIRDYLDLYQGLVNRRADARCAT